MMVPLPLLVDSNLSTNPIESLPDSSCVNMATLIIDLDISAVL